MSKRSERPGGDTPPKKKGKEEGACVTCAKRPSKKEDALECVWCDGVQHRECLQISVDQYAALADIPRNIVFFCSQCVDKYPVALVEYDKCTQVHEVVDSKLEKFEVALSNKFSDLKDELNSLSTKISSSIQEITKLDNQIKGSMNKGLEKYNETMVATLDDRLNSLSKSDTAGNDETNLPMKSVSQLATTIITEQREKERRQTNLIFHNIGESLSKDPQIRKQHDIKEITKLLSECMNVKCSIKNALRIGKKGQREKPRLLKIMFTTIEEKGAVLRNKSQLRKDGVPEYAKNIYITPDLTPTEQESNKKLRQELNTLNKDGKKYMIKNGAIVQRRA